MLFFDKLNPAHLALFDAEGSGGGQTGTGNDPAKTGNQDGAKFTQADVDRILTERLARAEESVSKRLLESLGVKDVKELKGKLTQAEEAEAAKLSDLDKAKKAAEKAQAAVEAANRERDDALLKAQRRLMQSAVIAEAVKQGFDDGEVASVWLALTSDKAVAEMVTVKEDGESFDGVDKAVQAIAKAHPRWLKEQQKPAPTPKGTPARNQGGQKTGNEREIGRQFSGF